MGTARPEKNRVDGIARRLNANEARRDRYLLGTNFIADDIESFERDQLGTLDTRSRGRSQAYLKLWRIGLRKQLCAEARQEKKQQCSSQRDIRKRIRARTLRAVPRYRSYDARRRPNNPRFSSSA